VVTAAVEEALGRATNESRNLRSIVDRVRPSVESVVSGRADRNIEALVSDAVRANVRTSVDHLRHGSALLEGLIQRDGLLVVGAEYSLDSSVVTFFDNP